MPRTKLTLKYGGPKFNPRSLLAGGHRSVADSLMTLIAHVEFFAGLALSAERRVPTRSGRRKADLVFGFRNAVRYPLTEAGIGVILGRLYCPKRERIDSM